MCHDPLRTFEASPFSVAPEPCLTSQTETYVTNWFQPAVAMVSTLAGTVKEKGGCESCDLREILASCDPSPVLVNTQEITQVISGNVLVTK